jgi:hypothetical protein
MIWLSGPNNRLPGRGSALARGSGGAERAADDQHCHEQEHERQYERIVCHQHQPGADESSTAALIAVLQPVVYRNRRAPTAGSR